MNEQLFDTYMAKIKDAGYKHTKPRMTILKCLIDHHDKHLSIEEVYELVRKIDPTIGIATAYRTMILFVDLGIVRKMDFGEGFYRYEISEDDHAHQHHHLICVECGEVKEVTLDLLESLEDRIEKEEHFSILDHNVKFYGICDHCQTKRNRRN